MTGKSTFYKCWGHFILSNWVLVGHIGIIGHDRVMVSLAKPHYTNQGLKASRTLSINIVDEALLPKADYVGCFSGRERDKSESDRRGRSAAD